jgi:hypothetical protein
VKWDPDRKNPFFLPILRISGIRHERCLSPVKIMNTLKNIILMGVLTNTRKKKLKSKYITMEYTGSNIAKRLHGLDRHITFFFFHDFSCVPQHIIT